MQMPSSQLLELLIILDSKLQQIILLIIILYLVVSTMKHWNSLERALITLLLMR